MTVLYDRIGAGYGTSRRTEPRWMRRIEAALGDATTVLNVGAGTGSYEPRDRRVVAVEPSETMIAQRRNTHPIVRAAAEALPIRSETFDAALAVLTIHHWTDPARGIAEMRRVAARSIVLTCEPGEIANGWLDDYFPAIGRTDAATMTPLDTLAEWLGGARIETLPVPHDCVDGFCGAYWRRPERYLEAGVRAAISGFAVIPASEVARGVEQLRHDLDTGAWHERHGHLMQQDELDLGYRLVVSS